MKAITLFLAFLVLTTSLLAQKGVVNIETELKKLYTLEDLPRYLQGTAIKQASSYDTTGNNDDGFSGKYSFLRRNADSSLVIFDAPNNGVINRIWTPTPTNDILDFYFGSSTTPAYSIAFSDLFSGKVSPFVAPVTGNELGGYYCYFPIPFKGGCKIVFRGKKLQFYQIQYRNYDSSYEVQNFSPALTEAAKQQLSSLTKAWAGIQHPGSVPVRKEATLSPGSSVTLAGLNQGGRITGVTLQPASAFSGLNKQIDLRITWDNESMPAINMPAADFFGYAFGKPSMQSLLLGSSEGMNYCYLPMPFDHKAKIELVYRKPAAGVPAEPVKIRSEVFVSAKKHEASKEGKLYAYWNRDKETTSGKPHVFLEGQGRGHYVATILQAQGLRPGMTLFFEGDDVTYIDGEMSLHGTGSEDYFNGGWYALLDRWDRKMSLPLHVSLDYSLPFARTGGYRLFISDKMPFQKEFKHSIEHGPEQNNKAGDYTSVAFYYADRAINTSQPKPVNGLTDVFIPDTLIVYPQLMQYSFAGAVKVEGNSLISSTGGQVRIDLSELPKGSYKLFASIDKLPDGAEISIWQRQKPVSEEISFYADQKTTINDFFLADIILDEFKNGITYHFRKNDARNKIYIRRLILIRQKTL